jgi:hypothetical protein
MTQINVNELLKANDVTGKDLDRFLTDIQCDEPEPTDYGFYQYELEPTD